MTTTLASSHSDLLTAAAPDLTTDAFAEHGGEMRQLPWRFDHGGQF